MNPDNPASPEEADDDDKVFERELRRLYRSALCDEAFQQQLVKDFTLLSEAGKALLHPPERAFVQHETLSPAAKARLLEMLPACVPAPTKPMTWLQRLGLSKAAKHKTGVPTWSVPAALMAGLMLGVMLPSIMAGLVTREAVMRGEALPSTDLPANSAPIEMTFSPEIKQNPALWLNGIAELVRQGKVNAAVAELDEFKLRYPNYRAP